MATASSPIGEAVECPIEVYEEDTEDFIVELTDDGAAAAVEDWTAELRISDEKNGSLTSEGVNTYTGTAPSADAGGEIPIDMAAFDLPNGDYFYQIQTVDTTQSDNSAKTRFWGKFKVLPRIQ